MAKLKDKVTRKNLPTGQDGEALVLDSNSPDGLRWAPGIDRLITDIAPELAGDLDASDYSITGINDLEFTDVEGEIAGIENQNLLDKTAAESISGVYTHDANIVMSDNSITGIDTLQFTDAAGTVAGIQNGNLVDKSATETIGGAWTYGDAIAMDDNKITGLGDPTADQDAATKTYVDTQHAGYLSASKGWVAGWNFDTADPPSTTFTRPGATWFAAMSSWTVNVAADPSGWAESGGEFSFTGDYGGGTRVFAVNWSFMDWYLTNSDYTAIIGKVAKKPSAGTYSDVDGSIEMSAFETYLVAGSYYFSHSVSGSCIVSLSAGDLIKFQRGMYSFNAAGTYVAYSYASHLEGATVTITPID